MPLLAGDGLAMPYAAPPRTHRPTGAHPIGKCGDDHQPRAPFAASIDVIRRFTHAHNATAVDQIPIDASCTTAHRIAAAVSSPGACPSPRAKRADH